MTGYGIVQVEVSNEKSMESHGRRYNIATDLTTLPLCVDLDGTLVKTDTLIENIVAIRSLSVLLRLPFWLLRGKAWLKEKLAERVQFDVARLPYNNGLLEYLRQQKQYGRHLILVTGANFRIAHSINRYLNVFDEVLASNAERNLKGKEKAEALVQRFGVRGFSYAGNDRTDLAVWGCAATSIFAGVSNRVAGEAAKLTEVEAVFSDKRSRWRLLIRQMRVHQWTKNLLVFLPLITSRELGDLMAVRNAIVMFIAFCGFASAIYVINDLHDLQADRGHPTKQKRPLASGDLPMSTALVLATALILSGVIAANLVFSPFSLPLLILYGVISFTYSIKLKQRPLVDVFTLAALYSLRVLAGGEASNHRVSFWLLAFCGFLFLGLSIMKRVAELNKLDDPDAQGYGAGRGYLPGDSAVMQALGVAATFCSSVVLALYIHAQYLTHNYFFARMLWFLVPLVLFWQCRLWLSTARNNMNDDPIVYTIRDWVSWIVGFLMLIVLGLASVNLKFLYEW